MNRVVHVSTGREVHIYSDNTGKTPGDSVTGDPEQLTSEALKDGQAFVQYISKKLAGS